MKNLLFNLVDGSAVIDGMSAGEFTSMWGRVVAFKKEELSEYLSNTTKALSATVDANGELVGFPVDAMGHEHEEAAGWVKGCSLDDQRGVIQLEVEWNELGKSAIAEKRVRYFSPEIDIKAKVIMGGSLTNWPAMRDKEHQILLKPVTLSLFSLDGASIDERLETIRRAFYEMYAEWDWETYPVEVFEGYLICRHDDKYWQVNYTEAEDGSVTFDPMDTWVEVKHSWVAATLEKLQRVLSGIFTGAGDNSTTEVDMEFDLEKATPEQKEVLLSQARASVIAEMQTNEPAELAELIKARTDEGVQAVLAVEKRKSHVAEFSARVVGGTPEAPVGLPVAKDALESLLLSLPEDKQAEVETLLGDIVDKGIVPFTELGHGRVAGGNRELPAEMKVHLQKWVGEGNKVEAWFTVNAAELGDMSEYNLAEFQEK